MSKNLSQDLWDRLESRFHLGCVRHSTRASAQAKACGSLCWIAAIAWVTAGCHLMVNPFTDELAGQQAVTTPSAEGAGAVQTTAAETTRQHARVEVAAQNGSVTHGPLYFDSGFGKLDSDDGRFAWTYKDYIQLFHWRGRFLFDAAMLPIHAVVTPPWAVEESDG